MKVEELVKFLDITSSNIKSVLVTIVRNCSKLVESKVIKKIIFLITMILRKCALKHAITILAIAEPGNSIVFRFLVSENERDPSSSERQKTPCLENTRQQHQPLRKLAP